MGPGKAVRACRITLPSHRVRVCLVGKTLQPKGARTLRPRNLSCRPDHNFGDAEGKFGVAQPFRLGRPAGIGGTEEDWF